MSIVEDRSCCGAELIAASVAVELVASLDARDFIAPAGRAGDTGGPAQRFKVISALVFRTELLYESTEV